VSLPRLVATDLDGTLVHSDGTITARTRAALTDLDHRGVPVVFVTARPLRWMDDLWEAVGRHGLAVVSNGAILYDVAAQEIREVTGIDAEAGRVLCDAITAAVPGVSFALECVSGFRREPLFPESRHVPEDSQIGPLAELWTEPAVKLLVRREGMDPDEFRTAVIAAVGDAATPTWSGDWFVEISAPGITKAATLAKVAAELGVEPDDVVAFGDMPNDLPMLAWAGSSYAVANADPTVLAAADHVAPANDDDGVAVVLADIFGL